VHALLPMYQALLYAQAEQRSSWSSRSGASARPAGRGPETERMSSGRLRRVDAATPPRPAHSLTPRCARAQA